MMAIGIKMNISRILILQTIGVYYSVKACQEILYLYVKSRHEVFHVSGEHLISDITSILGPERLVL